MTSRANARGCAWIHLLVQMDGRMQVSCQGKVSALMGNMTGNDIVNAMISADS